MDLYTALLIIAIIYCVLFFFDSFFKTCAHYPYLKFLEGTGFEIKFFYIKWTTKAFNRPLIRWGNARPLFLNGWFSLGLCSTLILLPIALCLLFISILQNFGTNNEENVVLQPIIPGVNLPISELGYYGLSLLLCSVVHEMGHALAAVKDDVHLNHVGVTLLYCLPVAFVDLGTEKLFAINKWKTLKILSAGIWHNLVLSTVAYFIYILLPFIFSIAYHIGSGISVSSIAQVSPLYGPKGLQCGDVILKINDCTVSTENSWYNCLNDLHQHKPAFCIDSDLVRSLDESIPLKHSDNSLDCCDNKKSHLCFEFLDNNDGILEVPSHACLPARTIIEKSNHFCGGAPHYCPNNLFCYGPLLTNNTNLFKIKRLHNSDVIYIGFVHDFYRTIEVSSFRPKWLFQTTTLPDVVAKSLKYVTLFSFGLAIINVIPCMFMDGQHITNVLSHMLFDKKCGKDCAKLISTFTTWSFTALLIFHCIYTLCKLKL